MALKREPTCLPSDEPVRRRPDAELIADLSDDRADVRRRAALDLDGSDRVLDAVIARIGIEHDRAVREALLTTVARRDDAVAATRLAPLLRSEDAALRNAVVDALAQMPTGTAAIMDELAGDREADVRVLAVMVMSVLHHPRVPLWLTEVVERDTDANVVAAAVSELAEVGDATHLAVVQRAAERFPHDPFLAFCVARTEQALDTRTWA